MPDEQENGPDDGAESTKAQPSKPAPRKPPWAGIALLGAVIVFAYGLYATADPIPSSESYERRAMLAAFGVVLALIYAGRTFVHKSRGTETAPPRFALFGPGATRIASPTWAFSLVLSLTCVFAVFNYYRFDGKAIKTVEDHYDITYYYLNSKYFDELGYYDIYAAMLAADEDHSNRLEFIRDARDLRTYEVVGRREVLKDKDEIRARFTDERWESFKRENDFLVSTKGEGALKYFFRDHGYNPPPTWTLVGGFFSNRVEIDQLKWITMVDFVLVFLMFIVILRTYGLEAMLFALLFMACTASGKWPVVGQALLRFDWLVALVMSMCMLKQGRHGLAGGMIAYASLSRIFPAIFFFPYLVLLVVGLVKRRSIDRQGRRFILGAAIVSVVMLGGALANTGVQSFKDSAHTLALHQSAESYSSLRVGLGDALIYRGERNWQHLRSKGGIPGRADELAELKPVLNGIGLVVLGLIAFYIHRKSTKAHAALPLAYFAFFALTTPQINYHNLRLLLVVWHAREPGKTRNAFALTCLFATEIIAHYAAITGNIPYSTTSLSSVGLTFYAVGMVGTLMFEALAHGKDDGFPARAIAWCSKRPVQIAVASLALLGGIWSLYWRAGELPPPHQTYSIDEVDGRKRPGTRWNADGNLIPDYSGIRIDMGERSHARTLEVSFERDDSYQLLFFDGEAEIGKMSFRRRGNERSGTLTQRRLKVPQDVRERGFDRIHLLPMRGNSNFSIGHVRPLSR